MFASEYKRAPGLGTPTQSAKLMSGWADPEAQLKLVDTAVGVGSGLFDKIRGEVRQRKAVEEYKSKTEVPLIAGLNQFGRQGTTETTTTPAVGLPGSPEFRMAVRALESPDGRPSDEAQMIFLREAANFLKSPEAQQNPEYAQRVQATVDRITRRRPGVRDFILGPSEEERRAAGIPTEAEVMQAAKTAQDPSLPEHLRKQEEAFKAFEDWKYYGGGSGPTGVADLLSGETKRKEQKAFTDLMPDYKAPKPRRVGSGSRPANLTLEPAKELRERHDKVVGELDRIIGAIEGRPDHLIQVPFSVIEQMNHPGLTKDMEKARAEGKGYVNVAVSRSLWEDGEHKQLEQLSESDKATLMSQERFKQEIIRGWETLREGSIKKNYQRYKKAMAMARNLRPKFAPGLKSEQPDQARRIAEERALYSGYGTRELVGLLGLEELAGNINRWDFIFSQAKDTGGKKSTKKKGERDPVDIAGEEPGKKPDEKPDTPSTAGLPGAK